MALKPGTRPAPLRTDSSSSTKSLAVTDVKKPQTPGSKFTSFFTRKPSASPGAESSVTDISDRRSPLASPYAGSPHASNHSVSGYHFPSGQPAPRPPQSQASQDSIDFDPSSYVRSSYHSDAATKCLQLEAELREISTELAGSIKREMDLEDLVDRLQAETSTTREADRTSDYFSDSGTSSIRPSTVEDPKEEIQRIKREAEQLRAQLKVEMSQKWQSERSSRQAMEAHIQILEQKLSQNRRETSQSADINTKARELEVALDDARRRLAEERQTKENFEDLLTALRVDLEQHRNDRDNLRDEVVPQLRAQIEGLEANLSESQKSPYDFSRMQQEIQSLRDENAALQSARAMNMQFRSIAEEGDLVESPRNSFIQPRSGGLQRSSTIHINRANSRATPNRSNSLSRSNSIVNRAVPESQQSIADQLKDVTQQRDALHMTVKYLLRRQDHQRRQFDKKLKLTEAERDRASSINQAHKGGYEREVRTLRSEINLLRKRADDALEQKWQLEKGLSGFKMDLDRSKQETASLHTLLQARDESAPEVLSSTLEKALRQLQQQREQARPQESLGSLQQEQELSNELEKSAQRSEELASQVRQQMQANAGLRNRLQQAIERGENNQAASTDQINELQGKLRKLEDVITVAQMQSETAVMKHEEEVRVLRASHNIQLMRTKSGRKTPGLLTPNPRSPISPMFVNSKKSPRLDQTTTGPGINLQQALKTEYLENKVAELEKALSEAEKEMGEVVGRMNTAQIGVAELESER
jgi:chromosome segregation ATPase